MGLKDFVQLSAINLAIAGRIRHFKRFEKSFEEISGQSRLNFFSFPPSVFSLQMISRRVRNDELVDTGN